MLTELLDEVERLENKIAHLESKIVEQMKPYEAVLFRLTTVPGIDLITAWTLVAELGVEMTVFPDAAHAASWAGLVPGNFESAGKRKSNRTRKGNRWLRRALCQSAWAVSHTKDCYLSAHFYRRAARSGVKKAILATAHQLLIVVFHIIRDGSVYREQGGDFFDRLHPKRTTRRLVRRLERLGFDVALTPLATLDCGPYPIDCKHRLLPG